MHRAPHSAHVDHNWAGPVMCHCDSFGINCKKQMCYIAETVLVAHCLDCPVIRKQKVLVSLQTMPHLKNTRARTVNKNKK